MSIHFKVCETDADWAAFTLFFIQHRKDFSHYFSLSDALLHTLETIQTSNILLIIEPHGSTIGWVHYRYLTQDYEPHPSGEIAFVDSVIMTEAYRSSRLFIRGFRHLSNHIAAENEHVRQFQFCALADNTYLTRLYSKFAAIIGQREGYHGTENMFSTEFTKLLHYLRHR